MTLTPRLVVPSADAAARFYAAALGAEPGLRLASPDGTVVHHELALAGIILSLTEAEPTPGALGGTPVILHLLVDDPDAVQARWVEAGGEVVFAVADRFYGVRDGRLRCPAGHEWLVAKPLQHLDEDELQRRTDDAM